MKMKVKLLQDMGFYRDVSLSHKEYVVINKGTIVEVDKLESFYYLKDHGTILFHEAEEVLPPIRMTVLKASEHGFHDDRLVINGKEYYGVQVIEALKAFDKR